jgi:hypothetical protein
MNDMPALPVPAPPIASFERNVYSQCGEDGIIEEILRRICASFSIDSWCVEFGALDGIYLSNTYNLIRNKGYKAVLIEADRRQYAKLCRNVPQPEVIKICRLVGFEGESALDCILRSTPVPDGFDVLSIDIDGCDYHVLESLKTYRPKVICIEFNPTVPNEVEFVQPSDFSIKQGSGAKSIVQLAVSKGYALAAATFCNLIFVRADLKTAVIGAEDLTLESIRDDSQFKSFLFFGYDGTVLTNKVSIVMPWHRIRLESKNFQQLPKYLRKFGGDYGFLQKVSFAILLLLKFPRDFPTVLREFVGKYRKGN